MQPVSPSNAGAAATSSHLPIVHLLGLHNYVSAVSSEIDLELGAGAIMNQQQLTHGHSDIACLLARRSTDVSKVINDD